MTDVEAKTPTKRKNSTNLQNKKGSAKKIKVDNAKIVQKSTSPKGQIKKKANLQSTQKFNKKNKLNSELKGDTSNKLKAFPGTQAAINNSDEENKKIKGGEKRKKRTQLLYNLQQKVYSENKHEALETIKIKIKEIESRTDLTKTAKRKLRVLMRLKKIAEGQPQEKVPNSKSESNKPLEKKERKSASQSGLQKKEPGKIVQQTGEVKINGKPKNKKAQVQSISMSKKTVIQKQVAPEDSEEEDANEEEGDSEEESDDENSGEEVEVGGESEDEEAEGESDEAEGESDEAEGESDEAEGESDNEEDEEEEDEESEDDSEEDSPAPPKVSNKKQKKK